MQVPQNGMPACTRVDDAARSSSKRASSFITVVDSPPGTTSASTRAKSSGVLDGDRGEPRMRSQRREMFRHVALKRENAYAVSDCQR